MSLRAILEARKYQPYPTKPTTSSKTTLTPAQSESSEEEEVDTNYIIANKPPAKVVREFFRENIDAIEDQD